jgi:hypothetical protein
MSHARVSLDPPPRASAGLMGRNDRRWPIIIATSVAAALLSSDVPRDAARADTGAASTTRERIGGYQCQPVPVAQAALEPHAKCGAPVQLVLTRIN